MSRIAIVLGKRLTKVIPENNYLFITLIMKNSSRLILLVLIVLVMEGLN